MIINLKGIKKTYPIDQNHFVALKGIDLLIDDGDFVSIMGPSGSGKSTLMNIIGLLDDFDEGEYIFNGINIRDMPDWRQAFFRNRHIGFIFQAFNLLYNKTALDNVSLPLFYRGIGRKERNRLASGFLEKLGLLEWAQHRPDQLSGGQKQRVAIARALIADSQIILADEPTGALDSHTSQEIMSILHEINRSGKTIVLVTHEREIANQTNRIIFLKDGKMESDQVNHQLSINSYEI